MTCAITTSFLGCLVTIFLFFRCIAGLDISLNAKSVCFAISILIGCIPLFVSYNTEATLGKAYPFYRYALYFIFVGCIIFLTLILLRDIVWTILFKTGFAASPLDKTVYIPANIITVVLAVILTFHALYEGTKTPNIKNITIASPQTSTPKTIAVLSDLHIHRVICPDKIRKIIEKTNRENPDIIILAGDIIDDDVNRVSGISALLANLKAKNGIYFVTGNHEFYAGYRETVEELKNLGFTFLENSGVSINEIYLAGIPDLFSAPTHKLKIDTAKAFSNATPNQYRILISHTPADFGANNNFNLEISGHTHGGQIFPFHIFTKLANRYLFGLSDIANNASIYVSRGAGQWGPQMRFLAPSEITTITLTPQN